MVKKKKKGRKEERKNSPTVFPHILLYFDYFLLLSGVLPSDSKVSLPVLL